MPTAQDCDESLDIETLMSEHQVLLVSELSGVLIRLQVTSAFFTMTIRLLELHRAAVNAFEGNDSWSRAAILDCSALSDHFRHAGHQFSGFLGA